MAGNNKEAAISVNYFKTFQWLVDSVLALLIKLTLFELRPVACVFGNLEKMQISGLERGEQTFQMGCLLEKKGKARHGFATAVFPCQESAVFIGYKAKFIIFTRISPQRRRLNGYQEIHFMAG